MYPFIYIFSAEEVKCFPPTTTTRFEEEEEEEG
jgi:hypothetical protein